MAEQLTQQQRMAVENRGGKLLVSAAAGSGKTKVLVDRLMGYLLDPMDPANIDDFLIITYTKAAAAELRGKIAAKLQEHIALQPENRHLRRQLQRLYLTKISTVHAFCADILREYAYRLDLAPDFRVADENECRELRDTTVSKILDQAYDHAGNDENFCAFVDTQGLGRDDRLVPEIVLKVYDSARCHLDPDHWLQQCIDHADVSNAQDASEVLWGRYLLDDLHNYLDLQIQALSNCAALAEIEQHMEKPAMLLRNTISQLQQLRDCTTWDAVVALNSIDYGRLTFSKNITNLELAERIKAVRKACKAGLDKKLQSFSDDSAQVLSDLAQTRCAILGLSDLVRQFSKEYDRIKVSRRVLDFGDLEHRTLNLLLGKSRNTPTQISRELAERFREILVDEYQDSNAVQDAIFSVLTSDRQNCFMVGDVKQSIYQFRLADPGIFLEKYRSYCLAEDASAGQGRKILLSSNFRSCGAVLSAANDVFATCMSPAVGGLYYGDEEALREGIPHQPLDEPEVELHCLQVVEDTYLEEASFTANRIRQLLDGKHMIRQRDELRPIRPEDIVILLRSPGSVGIHYRQALEQLGIRCSTGTSTNLLDTEEIGVLRSILQIVSNPRQDIPLIAALASPVFAFSADELAQIRANNRKCYFYDALLMAHSKKAEQFLVALHQLRHDAKLMNLAQLISRIYEITHLDRIYGAMDGASVRQANLQIFYQMAASFEGRGHRDLAQFLEHLAVMEHAGLAVSAQENASDCVTLMSIHKSKGLEFPVVFLCGLSREFNRESLRAQVLCDQSLGLGLSAADPKNRVRYPTIAKRAIAARISADSISEELRVLYVAMTRPKDRLIMVYSAKTLEDDLKDIALRMNLSPRELLTGSVVCPGEWVLQTAIKRTEAGPLHTYADARPDQTALSQHPWKITVQTGCSSVSSEASIQEEEHTIPAHMIQHLHDALAFRYGHISATQTLAKMTATQIKGRMKDQEAAENAVSEPNYSPIRREASFDGDVSSATVKGTAVHNVLQYVHFDACGDVLSIQSELQRMIQRDLITPEQAMLVDCEKIAKFFASDVGKRLIQGKHILREFKFSILEDGVILDDQLSGEQILLQGVVDCALVEDDGIVLLDFKTDRVSRELLESRVALYRPQVETYARALARIYELPIKEKYLYFFHLDQLIRL